MEGAERGKGGEEEWVRCMNGNAANVTPTCVKNKSKLRMTMQITVVLIKIVCI